MVRPLKRIQKDVKDLEHYLAVFASVKKDFSDATANVQPKISDQSRDWIFTNVDITTKLTSSAVVEETVFGRIIQRVILRSSDFLLILAVNVTAACAKTQKR